MSRRMGFVLSIVIIACVVSVSLGAQEKPPVAETIFKNIQVLRGIPVDDFMDTMGIMSAALGFDCAECHADAGTDTVDWAFDTPRKRTARRMTLMVATALRNASRVMSREGRRSSCTISTIRRPVR